MGVELPPDMPRDQADDNRAKEREYAQELQREGRWVHRWRVVGEYSNYSVFDAADNDELYTLISGLPIFPHMDIKMASLAKHPSAIE